MAEVPLPEPEATAPASGAGRRRTVLVVGGGIAGLAAAWELTGAAGGDHEGPDGTASVVLVESDQRLGGKLRTVQLDGRPVDVGPDGFLGRRPEATGLCRELGIGAALEPIGASGAAVWARGRRRPMPNGLFLGVPTRLVPVVRSGILSPFGSARLIVDLVAPRPDRRGPLGDRAIGPLLSRKLGRQAVQRLVEPLLGGIYAGGVGDASAAAVFPALLKVSQGRASFMRSMGKMASSHTAAPGPAPAQSPAHDGADGGAHGGADGGAGAPATLDGEEPEPAFWGLRGGFATLVDTLAATLASRGVEIRTGCAVTALVRDDDGWRAETPAGAVRADGVVLAVPARAAADLLAPLDADAAAVLQTVVYASVAVVTLAVPEGALPDDLYGTGLLVPRDTPLPPASAASLGAKEDERCMVTACTYLSTKWPHLARPGQRLVRASVGRFGDDRFCDMDDDALVERVVGELTGLLGLTGRPISSLVTRWSDALPQYRVHHLLRVGSVEAAGQRLGALAVAGAAYRGVGVPACIASGRAAARAVLDRLRPSARQPETETTQSPV